MSHSSYQKINYTLRPAKSIERKMLGEAFHKLSAFGRLETYRYIGFGSTYFSDFILYHKMLGIKHMVSIEKDVDNQERFIFNCPFGCIHLEFGDSKEVLPTLKWDTRSIVWLDYDGPLNIDVLGDVKFCCANILQGSMILLSVNVQPEKLENLQADERPLRRLQLLKERVGEDKTPNDITNGGQLSGWGLAATCRRIMLNEIFETLSKRNGSRENKLIFQQLFNFQYADGAKMLTIGGIIYEEGQEHIVEQCAFRHLDFTSNDEKPYVIDPPNLSFREIRHLDTYLPNRVAEIKAHGVPQEDIAKYTKYYRHFPTFSEAEI